MGGQHIGVDADGLPAEHEIVAVCIRDLVVISIGALREHPGACIGVFPEELGIVVVDDEVDVMPVPHAATTYHAIVQREAEWSDEVQARVGEERPMVPVFAGISGWNKTTLSMTLL